MFQRKTFTKISLIMLVFILGTGLTSSIAFAGPNEQRPFFGFSAGSEQDESGILVTSVDPDGPAAAAGVVHGDIILQIDEQPVNTARELMQYMTDIEPDTDISLLVLHGDEERSLTITVADQDGRPYLGIMPHIRRSVAERMPEMQIGLPILEVVPDSPAAQAGLETSDFIQAIDGEAVHLGDRLADLIAAYEPGTSITLTVGQPGPEAESRDVSVELGQHPEREGVAYLGVYAPSGMRQARGRFGGPRRGFDMPSPEFGGPRDGFGGPERGFGGRGQGLLPKGQAFRGEMMLGSMVQEVMEDGPAAQADLMVGDIITAIDGEEIATPHDLVETIAAHNPGDTIMVTVMRHAETDQADGEDGEDDAAEGDEDESDSEEDEEDEEDEEAHKDEIMLDIAVTLAESEEAEGQARLGVAVSPVFHQAGKAGSKGFGRFGPRGFSGEDFKEHDFGPDQGHGFGKDLMPSTAVTVMENSPAAEAGLMDGDMITDIDGAEVMSPRDVVQMMANYEPGDTIMLTIIRSITEDEEAGEEHEEDGEEVLKIEVTLGETPAREDGTRSRTGAFLGVIFEGPQQSPRSFGPHGHFGGYGFKGPGMEDGHFGGRNFGPDMNFRFNFRGPFGEEGFFIPDFTPDRPTSEDESDIL